MHPKHLTQQARRRIEQTLRPGEFSGSRQTKHTQQTTLRCRVGDEGILAIVKPENGDDHNAGVADREAAAYELDVLIDLGSVPPTVTRMYQGTKLSVQLDVDPAEFCGDLGRVPVPEIRAAAAFDIAIGAIDRMSNNWMTKRCDECDVDHLVLIDNSWAFDWQVPVEGARTTPQPSDVVAYAKQYGGPDTNVLERIASDPAVADTLAQVLGGDSELAELVVQRCQRALAA